MVAAEVANYAEGIGWVDGVTDTDNCTELGNCILIAQVTLGAATVAAGQTSTARSTPDSVFVAGSMWVENTQAVAGTQHYFFPYAGVGGNFYVVSSGTYSLRGHRSETCNAQLYITNESGEQISIALQLGAPDFEYTGSLVGPGHYEFHLGLDHLHASSATIALHDTLDFELSIYRPASVSAEHTAWGTIKAQYR